MKKLNVTLEKMAAKIRKAAGSLQQMIDRFEALKAKELKKQKTSVKKKKAKTAKKPKKVKVAKKAKKTIRRKRK
jgi:hypothetical protein